MTIGIIGVGSMGQHFVARLLAAGYELVAFDTNNESVRKASELGATPAASVAELAAQVTDVYLCLPTPASVKCVVTELLDAGASTRYFRRGQQ